MKKIDESTSRPSRIYSVVVGKTERLVECSEELYLFLRDNIKCLAVEIGDHYFVDLK
jgi:hypothetical protein